MDKAADNGYKIIGKPTPLIDSRAKVMGQALYTDDIRLHNPLTIKILRSPHPSANILSVDITAALALPGVRGVLTGADFKNTFGVLTISKDEPALARTVVRYEGEPVAAVAAETAEIADKAVELIKVDYQLTDGVFDSRRALKATDHPLHPELGRENNLHKKVLQEFGDIDQGFEQADVVVEKRFRFASINHAFTEPHATQVEIDNRGNITVYSATQVPHYLHMAMAEVLEIPEHRIRIIKPHLGGGFGGKSDPFPHEMIAARFALDLGRNVKLKFSREDVFFSHHGRHQTDLTMKLGFCKEKGITALTLDTLIDGGAYGSFGIVTTYYNGVLLQGPYKVPNFRFHVNRLYTNKPMCGAMRGHGGVNPRFASEVLLDMACAECDLDPAETRLRFILKENTLTTNEFRVTSVGLQNGLREAMKRTDWQRKYGKLPFGKGIGVACGFFISGSALPIHWNKLPASTVRITLDHDGGVTVYSGASDIGQGSDTMLAQMAAEVLGQPMDNVKVISADTRITPVDLGSYSSRVTFMAGNASRNAAIRMRRLLVEAACELLDMTPPEYDKPDKPEDYFRQGGRKPDFDQGFLGPNPDYADGFIFEDGLIRSERHNASVTWLEAIEKALEFQGILQTSGTYRAPKMGGKFKGAGAGLSPSYSFTAFIVEVTVDPETGFIKVDKATCAHDCGFPLNPLAVNGQIEGCIHMGLGQALMEEMVYDNGATQNPSFLEYKIPSAFEQPVVDIVPTYSDDSEGPFGAKEAGEGILAPVIPAIANAVYDAVGIRLTQLPMRPDRVLSALARKKKTREKKTRKKKKEAKR
ncbi:MAG: molybdopterin-dependent oxidoreductase [Alphaproteobacteria bacterium]|nr:molybdopterin-dependent oxidoreductase [Alphaproteobacteria bacterium]